MSALRRRAMTWAMMPEGARPRHRPCRALRRTDHPAAAALQAVLCSLLPAPSRLVFLLGPSPAARALHRLKLRALSDAVSPGENLFNGKRTVISEADHQRLQVGPASQSRHLSI
jgi:hypothetical protein